MASREATDWLPAAGGLFGWAYQPGGWAANWDQGVALLIAGAIGAGVTLYLVDPDHLPMQGGAGRLRAAVGELDELKSSWTDSMHERRTLIASDPNNGRIPPLERFCDDLSKQVKARNKSISALRRSMLSMGLPLYVLLGGALASAIATTLLQALLLGVAWPASLQSVGILKQKEALKNQAEAGLLQAKQEVQDEKRHRIIQKEASIRAMHRLTRELGNSARAKPQGD